MSLSYTRTPTPPSPYPTTNRHSKKHLNVNVEQVKTAQSTGCSPEASSFFLLALGHIFQEPSLTPSGQHPLIATLLPPPSTHLPPPHAPSFLLPRPHNQSNLAHFSLVSSARAALRLLLRCLIVDTNLPFPPTPVKLPPIPCHTASPHAKIEVIRSRAAPSPGLAQQP